MILCPRRKRLLRAGLFYYFCTFLFLMHVNLLSRSDPCSCYKHYDKCFTKLFPHHTRRRPGTSRKFIIILNYLQLPFTCRDYKTGLRYILSVCWHFKFIFCYEIKQSVAIGKNLNALRTSVTIILCTATPELIMPIGQDRTRSKGLVTLFREAIDLCVIHVPADVSDG